MGRTPVVALFLASAVVAQLPQKLRDELNDKFFWTREKAVKELGAMSPSAQVSGATLASALAAALNDKAQRVRDAAAGFLGAGRPADIAVPALVRALAAYEDDCATAIREMVGKARESKKPSIFEFSNLIGLEGYGKTILWSLEDHWDDRAVAGVAKAVKAWKLDRVPAPVVRRACELLCYWGTRPGLDAVVEVMARLQGNPETRKAKAAPDSRQSVVPTIVIISPLTQEDYVAIASAVGAAVGRKGIERPVGFDSLAPAAWRALLISSAAKIPWSLPPTPPSGPGAASKPSAAR